MIALLSYWKGKFLPVQLAKSNDKEEIYLNKKRTLAMLLAGAMLLPANAFAASPEDFTDFPTDWYRTAC